MTIKICMMNTTIYLKKHKKNIIKHILLFTSITIFSINLIAQDYEKIISEAQECYQNNDFTCSEQKLIEAIEFVPKKYKDTYLLYTNLAYSQAYQDKTKEALKSINKAIKLQKRKPLLYQKRALFKISLSKYNSAIKDCDKAISLDDKNDASYEIRGDAYARMDKFDNAIKNYYQALDLNPENSDALFNLGYCYIKTDSLDKALALFDELINKYENKVPASKLALLYNNRADVFLKMKNLDRAIADIQKAIELDNDFQDNYVTYGEYGLAIEDYNLACENFSKAIVLGFDETLIKHYLKKCEQTITVDRKD